MRRVPYAVPDTLTAVTPGGAWGTVAGTIDEVGPEAALLPAALVAVTEKV